MDFHMLQVYDVAPGDVANESPKIWVAIPMRSIREIVSFADVPSNVGKFAAENMVGCAVWFFDQSLPIYCVLAMEDLVYELNRQA